MFKSGIRWLQACQSIATPRSNQSTHQLQFKIYDGISIVLNHLPHDQRPAVEAETVRRVQGYRAGNDWMQAATMWVIAGLWMAVMCFDKWLTKSISRGVIQGSPEIEVHAFLCVNVYICNYILILCCTISTMRRYDSWTRSLFWRYRMPRHYPIIHLSDVNGFVGSHIVVGRL